VREAGSAQAGTSVGRAAVLAPEQPFGAYADALGLAPQVLPESAPELEAELARLSDLVREDFAVHKSEPSSLPTSALRVLNLVAQPEMQLSELVSATSQDAAIAAAVLRVANSVQLAPISGQVLTVRDAITRLGVVEVGRVAGAVAARALFSPRVKAQQQVFAARFQLLHWLSSTAASGCGQLAMQRRQGRSDLAFLAGMLHDVGKSVALQSLASLVLAGDVPRDLPPATIDALLEGLHIELGTEVHAAWSLPEYLHTLCSCHHDPALPADDDLIEVHLVRIVSGLLQLRAHAVPARRVDELTQSVHALEITPAQLRVIDSDLRGQGARMRAVLGLPAPS
jgi:HD-like signal output (HDOD) protein